MYIRLLIALFFGGLLINADAFAKDALSSVKIVDGITQQRPPNTRQTIGRRYVWNFRGRHYTILMTIDLERYNSYSGKERYDIPKLVEEARTTIGNLTREFQRTFKRNRSWTRQDRVDFVLSFVQSLPYTLDDVTTGYDEFRRYAIETLIEGGGDCEDTTILVAAILRGLGEKTALIFTPGTHRAGRQRRLQRGFADLQWHRILLLRNNRNRLDCWHTPCICWKNCG